MVQLIQSVENLWDEWDIRLVVVGSLCLQIFLILFGSRRKYTAKNWIRILVWMVYLSADWVATFALGAISNFKGSDTGTDSNRSFILAFWAPFLLLHLGGPDTITAYAMEDNDLWLRHLLSLLVQVSLALYIFSRLWMSGSYFLPLLAIPILVAGTIKYGERNWVLRSVSRMNIENMVSKYKDTKPRVDVLAQDSSSNEGDARFLRECSEFLVVVMYLYKDLADSTTWKATSYWSYSSRDSSREEDWLKQVDLVLGFMYDLLYTKAKLVYSATGIIIRCVSLICCIATFSAFSLLIDKKLYSELDIIVSYLLMIGAIVLELYAIIVILFTDWTQYWLRSRQQKCCYPTFHAISSVRSKLSYDKTWSETVAQFNLIDFCTKREKPPCARITGLIGIAETIEQEWHLTSVDVPNRVKQLIFSQLLENRIENSGYSLNDMLKWRGDNALTKNECWVLSWSISPQSFGRSITLWHIATDICFYNDRDRGKFREDGPPDNSRYFQLGMLLSDYMAYILIMQRFLLPGANFKADCFEYRLIFAESIKTRAGLLSFPQLRDLSEVQEYRDVSGLATRLASEMTNRSHLDMSTDSRQYDWRTWMESIRLAQQIQLLEARGKLTNEKKWKMITEVWIETLCYAALQCPWSAHAKQLRRGGELLTYVHLVMAKLGINNSFRELGGG